MKMKMIKPLVIMPPNCIDAATKRKMQHAGYLIVETADFAAIRIVTPPPVVPMDLVASVAIDVISDTKIRDFDIREKFNERLLKIIAEQATQPVVK